MKLIPFSIILILLFKSSVFFAQNAEGRQLWQLTAKVSNSYTSKVDTIDRLADEVYGNDRVREFHATGKGSSSGQVIAIIENWAENPETEFYYNPDAGEPKNATVSGSGSEEGWQLEKEVIGGKLIMENASTDQASGGSTAKLTSIQFTYTGDEKSAEIGIAILAKGSHESRYFYDGKTTDNGENIEKSISCIASCDQSSKKGCSITKTDKGYQISWNFSRSWQAQTYSKGMGFFTEEKSLQITIVPYKESDKPEVSLYGCSELGTNDRYDVFASGKPEGGKYRFWVEPASMMTVEADDESSAILTGATPGKGTLYVEYTAPDGKTAQASKVASYVKVENYNGGQPMPQIALYDIDGKKQSGIKTVPVDAQPANASELVKFVPADPGVLSAVGVGNEVTLQGLRVGKTTLQAKTDCDEKTGPAVEVEVVNCDDETKAALERMRKAAIENLVDATERLQKTAGSKEFEKARDELVSSTIELLAKAGLTIVANGKTSGAVKVAAEIADKGTALSEMIASANAEELKNNVGKTASGEAFEKIVEKQFGEAVGDLWGKSLSAATGIVEVQQAAQKFGENIREILKHEAELEDMEKGYEAASENLKRIEKRQQFCKNGTGQPQAKEQPKSDQTPKSSDPTPPKDSTPTPKPKPKPTTGEQPNPTEPTPAEPKSGDEVIGDPEPPTVPPRQVGLPYEPSDCGCGQSKDLTIKSADFSKLGIGMKNLGDCVEKFRSTTLTDYQLSLQEISELTDSLSTTLKSDAAEFLVKAKASKPRLDELVSRVRSYDKAGNEFLKKMDKCPDSVTTGMEIFKSVETITVDSIKTNY